MTKNNYVPVIFAVQLDSSFSSMNSVKNFSDKIKSFFASPDFQNYHISSRKIYYIVFFILPFLIIYEIGLFFGAIKGINGADAVLRILLHFFYTVIGIDITRIIFAFIIIGLLSYLFYYLNERKIEIRPRFLLYMLLESMAFAILAAFVVYVGLSFQFPKLFTFQPNQIVVEQMAVHGLSNSWGKLVSSIGAGVFEEFIFRFILLNGLIVLLEMGRDSYENESEETARAILLSSLLFTLVHLSAVNISSLGSILGLGSIFVASVIFSIVYLKRGYAIAAGTHIFYDIYLMFGIIS